MVCYSIQYSMCSCGVTGILPNPEHFIRPWVELLTETTRAVLCGSWANHTSEWCWQNHSFSHLLSKSSHLHHASLWLTHGQRGRKAHTASFLHLNFNFSSSYSLFLLFALSFAVTMATAKRSRKKDWWEWTLTVDFVKLSEGKFRDRKHACPYAHTVTPALYWLSSEWSPCASADPQPALVLRRQP